MPSQTIADRAARAPGRTALPSLGPGTCYNIGNVIALATGLTAVALSPPADAAGPLDALAASLAGSPAAVAMTLAILVFFAGGEVYRRATRGGAVDTRLVRAGDLVSALGALLLSVSLWLLGDIVTAALSTVLLAGGKLGSALSPRGSAAVRVGALPAVDPFRWAVALSRFPALAGLALALLAGLPPLLALQSAILFGCYLIWLRADLLLLRTE